jgi:hypothetical protein
MKNHVNANDEFSCLADGGREALHLKGVNWKTQVPFRVFTRLEKCIQFVLISGKEGNSSTPLGKTRQLIQH